MVVGEHDGAEDEWQMKVVFEVEVAAEVEVVVRNCAIPTQKFCGTFRLLFFVVLLPYHIK